MHRPANLTVFNSFRTALIAHHISLRTVYFKLFVYLFNSVEANSEKHAGFTWLKSDFSVEKRASFGNRKEKKRARFYPKMELPL